MNRNSPFVFLFFLLLIAALVFTAAGQRRDESRLTPTPWSPVQITLDSIQPTLTPGWWDAIGRGASAPAASPFPTPTPRK